MNGYKQPIDRIDTITNLLDEVNRGNTEAASDLISAVYDELRLIAAGQMAGERGNHTLQPTALVHEVYLRMLKQRNISWENRAHFFAAAAQVMRRVLIDHARGRNSAKRCGVHQQVALEEANLVVEDKPLDLAVDDALDRLEQIDPRQTRIVEL